MSAAFWTLVIGAAALFISNVIEKLWFSSIFDARKTIGEIAYTLDYFAWVFSSKPTAENLPKHIEACDEARKLACRLRSQVASVPAYSLARFFKLLPDQSAIADASGRLIRLSNKSCLNDNFYETVADDTKRIAELLNIIRWNS